MIWSATHFDFLYKVKEIGIAYNVQLQVPVKILCSLKYNSTFYQSEVIHTQNVSNQI